MRLSLTLLMAAAAKFVMILAAIVYSVGGSKRGRSACRKQFQSRGRTLHELEMQLNLVYDCLLGKFAEIADLEPEVFLNYTKGSKLITHSAQLRGKRGLLDDFREFVEETPCDSFGCFVNKKRHRATCVFTVKTENNNNNSEDHEDHEDHEID
ncbi:unnamed protein product [Cylicocyclus nassatus]|uniref:Uncharacterized protein n=1 Tax=Cylicocyclus nassatus TaxID=53992 RepID=A0AA36GJ32_CYLNA|nr:unnamed protein product [Cylicocyclus nassatus]